MMEYPKTGFEMPEKAAAKEPIAIFTRSLFFRPNQILRNILVFVLPLWSSCLVKSPIYLLDSLYSSFCSISRDETCCLIFAGSSVEFVTLSFNQRYKQVEFLFPFISITCQERGIE